MDIRIPKHVEEKDRILGLQIREWLYMIPFIAGVYGIGAFLHFAIVVKIVIMVLLIGVPWNFMAQKTPSGRRNAVLIVHRFRAGKRQHVFRHAGGTVVMKIGDDRERESERALSREGSEIKWL